jgi:protein SCO1/2
MVGTPLDQIFLFCFHYDPQANSYVANATNLMRLGGVLTMLALGLMLVLFWRREGRGEGIGKWELEKGDFQSTNS